MLLEINFVILATAVSANGFNYEMNFRPPSSSFEDRNVTLFRLPDTTQPNWCDLTITTHLEGDFNFNGTVVIRVHVLRATREIILHCKDLRITEVHLSHFTDQTSYPTTYVLSPERQLLIINTGDQTLPPGTACKLVVRFAGKLNDEMVGFYRSSYREGKITKWLAATRFEPTYARSVFPCYDEPRFKTIFTIRLSTAPHHTAVSNMEKLRVYSEGLTIRYYSARFRTRKHFGRKISSGIEDGITPENILRAKCSRTIHEFRGTRHTSTHLLAFVVSEFKNRTDSRKTFGAWARENEINDTIYAYEVGPKLIKAMKNYTSIRYILDKMDLVAVPDTSVDATKSWGMISIRDREMLYDNSSSSENQLQTTTLTLARATAYQWFGAYVTPTWWQFHWLSEGFAKYLEYKITAMIEPTWRTDEYFVADVQQKALFADGTYTRHALTVPVRTLRELDDRFDGIASAKGASVLRMLEHSIVSPDIFRKALNRYLTFNQHLTYGLVEPDNLWTSIQAQLRFNDHGLPSGITISDVMTKWTTNEGYPLVTVSRSAQPGQLSSILLSQKPYDSSYRSISPQLDARDTWIVPITYTIRTSKNFSIARAFTWSMPGVETALESPQPDDWILLNLQQTGYYRVNYDLKNWQLLIEQLKTKPDDIHALNRAQLIDDSWTLAIDNELPFSVPLSLTTYLIREEDPIPWFSAVNKFEYLYSQFQSTDTECVLSKYMLEHLEYQYNRLGFYARDTDDHLTAVLRSSVISLACRMGLQRCVQQAEQQFADNLSDLSKVKKDVKDTVFCTALRSSKFSSVWTNLWILYFNSPSAHEKETILNAFGCTNQSTHLKMYLNKVIDEDDHDIRKQDRARVYRQVLSTSIGVTVALQFIDGLIMRKPKVQPAAMQAILYILESVKHKITSEEQITVLQKLISDADKSVERHEQYIEALKVARDFGEIRVKRNLETYDKIKTAVFYQHNSGHYRRSHTLFKLIPVLICWLVTAF